MHAAAGQDDPPGEPEGARPRPAAPESSDPSESSAGPLAPAAPPPSTGHPRRWFLTGVGALLLGAGAGVGAQFARHPHRSDAAPAARTPPPPRPAALVAAADRERRLLADLDATTDGSGDTRLVVAQVRADHGAHLRALEALLAPYHRPQPTPSAGTGNATSASAPTGRARSREQLRTAEHDAAGRGAAAAAGLAAQADAAELATLLAMIAACETTHAELLA